MGENRDDFKSPLLEAEDFKSKVGQFLGDYMFFFIALLVCAGYMLKDLFNIQETGKSIKDILVDSSTSLLMGILIANLLGTQGILRGEKSREYIEATENHKKKCDKVRPHLDAFIGWCKDQNQAKIVELRTQILNNEELDYTKYINGDYRGTKNLTKRQILAIHKARSLRITPLSASGLIGGETPKLDPFYLGDTKNQRLRKENRKMWLSKIALGILFGYFGIEAVAEVSVASLCWRALQVIIFVAGGFSKYWSNYYLMYNDMPIRMQKQDNYIEIFESWYANQPKEVSDEKEVSNE